MAKSGFGLRIAYKRESTWGTAATPDRSFRVVSSTLMRDVPQEDREYLLHGATTRVSREFARVADNDGGTVIFEALLEGMGPIWADCFGAAPATSGAGPYTHVYKFALGQMVGATIQESWYDNDTAGERGEIHEGAVCAGWRFTDRVGTPAAKLEVDYFCETSGGETGTLTSTTTAPFTTNDLPMQFNQTGSIQWNSSTIAVVTGMSIACDHGLQRRPKFGALTTAKPLPGRTKLTIELDIEWEGSVFDAGLTAGTKANFTVTYTNGSASAAWVAYACNVEKCSAPVSTGPGLIRQTVTLRPRISSTNEGIILTMINSQSAYDAA